MLLDGELDLGFAVERWSVAPVALDGNQLWSGQAQAVKKHRENDQRIPDQHAVAEARIEEAGQREEQARSQEENGAGGEAKGHAAVRTASGAHRLGMERGRNHPRGTATVASTSLRMRSASNPSSSASGLRMMRWRRTGSTARLTSSGTR